MRQPSSGKKGRRVDYTLTPSAQEEPERRRVQDQCLMSGIVRLIRKETETMLAPIYLDTQKNLFKVTSIAELGIDPQLTDDLKPSFEALSPDEYDLELYGWDKPKRFRAQTNAELTLTNEGWDVRYLPQEAFIQDSGDQRTRERWFDMIAPEVLEHPGFKQLLGAGALMVKEYFPYVTRLKLGVHQMLVVTTDQQDPATNSPEGMHQDGWSCPFIISAIPIILEDVQQRTAESVIYASDKETVLWRGQLQKGQIIFQDDTYLWHHVTPVGSQNEHIPTRRGILGIDFSILE